MAFIDWSGHQLKGVNTVKLNSFLKTTMFLYSCLSFSNSFAQEMKLSSSFEFLGSTFRLKSEWARATSPTINLDLGVYSLGFTNSTCTGSLISKSGHVLVARHCLEPAIGVSEQIRQSQNQLGPFLSFQKVGSLKIIRYDSSYLKQALIIPIGLDSQVIYARIFAIGPGYLDPRFSVSIEDPATKGAHDTLSDEGYSSGGDFAIVQIDELKKKKCFKLAGKEPEVGDVVQTTRFYCHKNEDVPWPAQAHERIMLTSPTAGIQDAVYIPKGSIVTDGRASTCNSGSAIRNLNNEIVGILHSVVPFRPPSLESGNSSFKPLFISVQRMLQLMSEKSRREILELNSSCDK